MLGSPCMRFALGQGAAQKSRSWLPARDKPFQGEQRRKRSGVAILTYAFGVIAKVKGEGHAELAIQEEKLSSSVAAPSLVSIR